METKILSTYGFSAEEPKISYDTNIPLDLFEAFSSLTEDLNCKTDGVYWCTPIIFDKETPGASVGILERRDGIVRKSHYVITIKSREAELREKVFSIRQVLCEKYDINKDEMHQFLIKRGYYKR